MLYHASSVKAIKTLEPRISNHDIPLIYFSEKRENVLVYLSNAVEKFCKEAGFDYSGVCHCNFFVSGNKMDSGYKE